MQVMYSGLRKCTAAALSCNGEQAAQLSQRERDAGWDSYGQRWKTGTARQYFTDVTGLSSTAVT